MQQPSQVWGKHDDMGRIAMGELSASAKPGLLGAIVCLRSLAMRSTLFTRDATRPALWLSSSSLVIVWSTSWRLPLQFGGCSGTLTRLSGWMKPTSLLLVVRRRFFIMQDRVRTRKQLNDSPVIRASGGALSCCV